MKEEAAINYITILIFLQIEVFRLDAGRCYCHNLNAVTGVYVSLRNKLLLSASNRNEHVLTSPAVINASLMISFVCTKY